MNATISATRLDARKLGDLFEADLIERLPDLAEQFQPYRWRDPARLTLEQAAELDRHWCHYCEQSRRQGGSGCIRHKNWSAE